MCKSYISRHIINLPKFTIFTTRAMLIYGTRSAVDSTLSRMVLDGFIFRVARGVFVKEPDYKPTMWEIVQAKTLAFGIKVIKHAETYLHELKVLHDDPGAVFAREGHSTSFITIHGRAYLRGVCIKKADLTRTPVGRIIYALWHLGELRCSTALVQMVTRGLAPIQREEFWLRGSWMPAWLNDMCRQRFPKPRVVLSHRYYPMH